MNRPASIALFLPNWLGDLTMATPTIRAVRRRWGPEARVVGIMRPNLAELLDGTSWLSEQWYFHPRAKQADLGRRALVHRMRAARFDTCILLTNSMTTAVVAALGGARRRIGYARYGRGVFLSDRVRPLRRGLRVKPTPVVEYYLRLAAAAGCADESPRLELATTAADRRLGERIWNDLGLRTDGRVIALNSSGAYGEAKRWPPRRFAELARLIVDRLDHDVLVVCGPKEGPAAREIAEGADRRRVFSLADQPLGLSTSKACLQRSRLVVSGDSGPRHVAAALGRPVITLLGPTVPEWIDNPTIRGACVGLDLDCSGCHGRTCRKKHHRCMEDLRAERVLEEVTRFLEESPSRRERAA